MSGTLYICGTPIGNLEDISLRVLRILKEVDLIAAEDTRHTLKLLNYYNISRSLTSYHEHNKSTKGPWLVEQLIHGKNIALVTDAGMPGISDPGSDLVLLCQEQNISVTIAPGPTAFVSALVLSGLNTSSFIFIGFLPRDKSKQKKALEQLKTETRTMVFYEAPHHLEKTLAFMYQYLGERDISIVRELTKKYEEVKKMKLSEAAEFYREQPPKGEFVLVVKGSEIAEPNCKDWEGLTVPEHVQMYQDMGHDKKTAMKLAAKDRNVSKRDIYNECIN